MSVFEELNGINVNENKSQKNNLDYLSWAWAWSEVKKKYPLTTYRVYENEQGLNYHHDNKTAWVKVGVTIEELEHIEYLPVMDFKNQSIKLENLTSMNVNKAIQRALVKAIARHGLGLYIYAGEDLPDLTEEQQALEAEKQRIREIQPLLKRAEQLGYENIESLKDKTKKEITDIMVVYKAQLDAEKGE